MSLREIDAMSSPSLGNSAVRHRCRRRWALRRIRAGDTASIPLPAVCCWPLDETHISAGVRILDPPLQFEQDRRSLRLRVIAADGELLRQQFRPSDNVLLRHLCRG